MSRETDRVIAGFMRLSSSDQNIVVQQINEYLEKDHSGKRELQESFERRAGLDLGPLNQGRCPCCGR